MALKTWVNGQLVICETVEELLAVTAAAAANEKNGAKHVAPQPRAPEPLRGAQPTRPKGAGAKQLRLLITLLERVESAGGAGVTVAELATFAKMNHPRGLGVFNTVAKRHLIGSGLDWNHAIDSRRGKDGVKRWHPGPKITEIKERLRKALS